MIIIKVFIIIVNVICSGRTIEDSVRSSGAEIEGGGESSNPSPLINDNDNDDVDDDNDDDDDDNDDNDVNESDDFEINLQS